MSKAHFILIGLVITTALGCSPTGPGNLRPSVSKLPSYHGQSRAQVIDQFGEPTRADRFPMSEAVGEFRIELYNTYPPTVAENAEVEIEELWWQSGDYWTTLWLHQVDGEWIVLDSCRWHKDIRF